MAGTDTQRDWKKRTTHPHLVGSKILESRDNYVLCLFAWGFELLCVKFPSFPAKKVGIKYL